MKDPTDTRDIGPRVGSPLWIHLTVVTFAGAVVFGLCLTKLAGLSLLVSHPLFWILAAMIVLGDIWPIVMPGRTPMEAPLASVTFGFAALIAWGLPVAILLRAPSTVVSFLARRKAPHRAAFNAAVATLGLAVGGGVLYLLRERNRPALSWAPDGHDLWKILLASGACFLLGHLLISTAIALHAREPVLRNLMRALPYEASVGVVLYAAAPLVAMAIHTGSAWLVLLFGFPLGAIYANAAVSVKREHQAHHDELTGLANRKLLTLRLASALDQASNSGTKLGF